jgi:hypothetical protein
MAVKIIDETQQSKDTPWYESLFSWFGSTAKDVYTANLQSKAAKYEADAIRDAQIQQQNDTLSFFGRELSKETILWIFGGTVAAILILSLVRRR